MRVSLVPQVPGQYANVPRGTGLYHQATSKAGMAASCGFVPVAQTGRRDRGQHRTGSSANGGLKGRGGILTEEAGG